ncbi:MAG: hypothetical protein AAB778_02355 [Patescibacteria group bacterium]
MNSAQVKQAIKKSAQQIRQEPLELLKSAARQMTGSEIESGPVSNDQAQTPRDEVKDETKYKQQVAEKDGRHLQALESELKDIRRQKLFNDLMRRIQAGEEIPLEEFTELSYEQKDVLKAQMEAFKKQQAIQASQSSGIPMPSSKQGRKMGGGQKGAAKKEETRVEKPVPPSG